MGKERLFKMFTFDDKNDSDELGMILSSHINLMYNGNAAITVVEWDDLINDIIKWHNEKSKSNEDVRLKTKVEKITKPAWCEGCQYDYASIMCSTCGVWILNKKLKDL